MNACNFRTALQFSMSHSKNNIVLITGPTAGMGKSFVSANLAAVMASTGKRVLLIDSDLRNGHLHRYFDVGRQEGELSAGFLDQHIREDRQGVAAFDDSAYRGKRREQFVSLCFYKNHLLSPNNS